MKPNEHAHACCQHEGHEKKRPWYLGFLFLTAAGTTVLFAGSCLFEFLGHFRLAFLEYAAMMAIPIAAGFLIGGLIEQYVPQTYISKHLASHDTKTVFYATSLGFLMSACSHGILALSMALHRKGASGPAVVSFLLASPWANLPMTFILIGFFGWKGVLIIASALLVSVITGLLLQLFDRRNWIEKNRHYVQTDEKFSIRKDMAHRWKNRKWNLGTAASDAKGIFKGIWNLADMVLPWILIGIVLASLSAAFVPQDIFHRFLGPSLAGLAATLLLATVLEVCSEGTSPLAFEIYKQTRALGNAFAFLMGGVVTDYTEIGMLWKNVGPRTALWTLAFSLPQIVLLAWVFNQF